MTLLHQPPPHRSAFVAATTTAADNVNNKTQNDLNRDTILVGQRGVAYGAAMFGAGFVCGTVRVLAMEPVLGRFVSVALELPIMIAVCWSMRSYFYFLIGGSTTSSTSTSRTSGTMASSSSASNRFLAGLLFFLTAFTTLLALEMALAVLLFDKTAAAAIQEMFHTPSGQLGLVGQSLCSAFPCIPPVKQQNRPPTAFQQKQNNNNKKKSKE